MININISLLRQFLKKRLPDYMIPSFFIIIDKLPLTPNGKVDRKLLPDPIIDKQSMKLKMNNEKKIHHLLLNQQMKLNLN